MKQLTCPLDGKPCEPDCPVRFKMTGTSRRSGNAERRKEIARKLLLD